MVPLACMLAICCVILCVNPGVCVSCVCEPLSQWAWCCLRADGWPERVKADNRVNFMTHTLPALWSSIKEDENKTHIRDVFSLNQFLHIKHAEKISRTALTDLEMVETVIHQERIYLIEDTLVKKILEYMVHLSAGCIFYNWSHNTTSCRSWSSALTEAILQ